MRRNRHGVLCGSALAFALLATGAGAASAQVGNIRDAVRTTQGTARTSQARDDRTATRADSTARSPTGTPAAPARGLANDTAGTVYTNQAAGTARDARRSREPADPAVHRSAQLHRGPKILVSTREGRLLLISGRDTLLDASVGMGMSEGFEYGQRRVLKKEERPFTLDLGNGYLIHGTGTSGEDTMGGRVSHGSIRMTNGDVDRLYYMVEVGTPVFIY